MAEAAQLTATQRSELGSRANKRLRDSGLIPGVIYGHKEAVVPVSFQKKELVTQLEGGAHLFDIKLAGKSEKVLVKEVQYDHLGMEVLHVDFARVSLDERVEVSVPLELKGTPKGEAEGAVLQQIINELDIECLVTDIPKVIVHSVVDMEKDSVLAIKDLKLPPGVKCLQDEDLIVATVKEIQEVVVTPEVVEGTAAEPEVIGRKAEEEAAPAEGEAPAPAAKKEKEEKK
jgi:large subunit ribosomal protein L25